MPEERRVTARQSVGHCQSPPDESVWSLGAFWLIAFAGTGLFAAVLIAPKWEQRQLLAARVRALAAQCVYASDVNAHLNRVIEAFKHDPEFTAEVARTELGYVMAGEQRWPAPIRNWDRPKPPKIEPQPANLWSPFLRLFAHDTVVRRMATITAAVFFVVGLAFFNPSRKD
jgi:cell division protein FtsB